MAPCRFAFLAGLILHVTVAAAADEPELVETRVRWITAAGIGLVASYGASTWWQNDLSARFRGVNEGRFGKDTYAGGTDKLGHGFSGYVGTRVLSSAYRAAGLSPEASRDRAAGTALAALTAVEIIDGFSRKYGFSKEDALMNALGVGVGWALERSPAIDAAVDLRIAYSRSDQARRSGEWDPIRDYSGQTYLLALKLSGLPATATIPGVRHLELLVGYRARGFEAGEPFSARVRERVFGVGVNLTSLLGLTERSGPASRAAAGVLEFLQIPGTAVWDRRDIH